jgi:LysR family glycine cleavage system transcriptional activator
MRKLPPLNSLRAFEAAGRHLSFKMAADELRVTPAAVSQQVKLLENHFGLPLFVRLTRALRLTDAGRQLLPAATDGFDTLAEGVEGVATSDDRGILTVSISASFGAKWLVPRLEGFRLANPNFDVRVDVTDRLVDLHRENVDVAFRYGTGGYVGLESQPLLSEFMIPVCSPELIAGTDALRAPDDLRHHTLLHIDWRFESDAAPVWSMWLKAAGVYGVDADRGPRFTEEAMGVQAAIDGAGVVLASSIVVADDIAKGKLVRPFASMQRATTFTYFLVHRRDKANDPRVIAFNNWVKSEFSKTGAFMGVT